MAVADDVLRVRHHGLADLVHRSAARYADKLAVRDGDVALTYAEFETRVEAAAAAVAGSRHPSTSFVPSAGSVRRGGRERPPRGGRSAGTCRTAVLHSPASW